MRAEWMCYNGEFYQVGTRVFKAENRAFRYGDGVFETIRMLNGEMPFFDLHADRLWLSLYQLGIEPGKQQPEVLKNNASRLAGKNKMQNARIRLSVWREDGGMYLPANNGMDYLIEMAEIAESDFRLNETGMLAGFYRQNYKPQNMLSAMKSTNALLYVLAAKYAESRGWHDSLLLNANDRVVEATSSNIIVIKDNEAITPASSEGPVDGIMKEVLKTVLNRMNVDLRPGMLTRQALFDADEIWLTNAVSGIRWIGSIEDSLYSRNLATQTILALNKSIGL